MAYSVQANEDGEINVTADGDVLEALDADACCCLGGWHVALACPSEGGGSYGEAIYIRVGFACDGCPLNGGRILIVGGVCYEVQEDVGLPDETCSTDAGTFEQRPALVIDVLPEGEEETPWGDIICKEREATCEDAECVPIGPRECCLTVPVPPEECRCSTWAAGGRNHGPCVYGQLVRIRWTYFERANSWCASEPTGDPSDCIQTVEETFVGDGEAIGVYECIDSVSGLGLLTGWEGSVRRVHTNPYCPDSAVPYDHTVPWVPPSAVDLWSGVAAAGASTLPVVIGETATVGSCCASCGSGGASTGSNPCSSGGFCTTTFDDGDGNTAFHDEFDSCAVSGIVDTSTTADSFCEIERCEKERRINAAITMLERCQGEAVSVVDGAALGMRTWVAEDLLR